MWFSLWINKQVQKQKANIKKFPPRVVKRRGQGGHRGHGNEMLYFSLCYVHFCVPKQGKNWGHSRGTRKKKARFWRVLSIFYTLILFF